MTSTRVAHRMCVGFVLTAVMLIALLATYASASALESTLLAGDLHAAHSEWLSALEEAHEIAADVEDTEESYAMETEEDAIVEEGAVGPAVDSSFAEIASEEHTQSRSQSQSESRVSTGIKNGPITPVHRVREGASLQWKANLPSKMRFARMLHEAEDRLQHPERAQQEEEKLKQQHHSMVESHSRSKQSMRSRARAASRSRSRASAGARGDAPDGGDGDWTTKPSWWNPPSDVESASPWREDAHAYLLRHRDPNSNMNPDPFPTLASAGAGDMGRGGGGGGVINQFALHRLAGTSVIAGTPISVNAYQFPGAPPLPELDANMQPTNNYPNPPFYEHDYSKDYVWG